MANFALEREDQLIEAPNSFTSRGPRLFQGTPGRGCAIGSGQDPDHYPPDTGVIDWFKAQVNEAGGGNYQSLINDALKGHVQQRGLERALRKVIREELRRVV